MWPLYSLPTVVISSFLSYTSIFSRLSPVLLLLLFNSFTNSSSISSVNIPLGTVMPCGCPSLLLTITLFHPHLEDCSLLSWAPSSVFSCFHSAGIHMCLSSLSPILLTCSSSHSLLKNHYPCSNPNQKLWHNLMLLHDLINLNTFYWFNLLNCSHICLLVFLHCHCHHSDLDYFS